VRLLLDTHAFLWFVLNDAQLTLRAKTLVEDPANDIFISPASYWEIAIKVSHKKLDLFATFDDFMRRGIAGNDFIILPIEPKHTAIVATLPFHHKDPFDRLLIAQALAEGIPLISTDSAIDAYGVQRLW